VPTLSKSKSLSPLLGELNERELERIFGAEGHLSRFMKENKRDFEARPEQLEMAKAVAKAARDKEHLLVEAGTGTGKSYAYLVPLILWAQSNKKRVLIATGTKALQQQLVERDLPFLAQLFKKHLGSDFKFALCLGTGNYICPRRMAKAQIAGLFASTEEVEQLEKLHKFAQKTSTGRNLDMPFEPLPGLWSQVNRESDLCLGRNCQLYDDSFYWKARREQEKAQVLVANHHLLFAHIASGGNSGGVLPPFDAIVIDEAHHAEDVAASYLGLELSNLSAAKLIEMISNRRTGKTPISSTNWGERGELERRLADSAAEARVAVGQFFENLQLAVRFEPNRSSTVRITRPNLLENPLSEPFERLESALKDARKVAEREKSDDLIKELDSYANRCGEMRKAAKEIVAQTREGYVYWAQSVPRLAESAGKAARVPRLSIHGAPIEVAQALKATVFDQFKPVILTSATLTTGGSFDFLIDRLGLGAPATEETSKEQAQKVEVKDKNLLAEIRGADTTVPVMNEAGFAVETPHSKLKASLSQAKNGIPISRTDLSPLSELTNVGEAPARTLILGSPFDYQKNALVYVAGDLPDPANVAIWEEAAIKRAAEVIKRTDGKAFILCTSYRLVDSTARFLEKVMPKKIKILKQGATSRGKLLSDFRSDVHSVLVGTTSFWQGVDVPGESLSCVVIMKLPFAVPDDPMVQARVETIRKRGRDAFNEYQVPQAVMMFRQGFGRLIRTANDRGVVAILDPRVQTKAYGKTFLQSLPDCEVTKQLERISLFVSAV
jgi:ATP-dependent DNA helicase DinG